MTNNNDREKQKKKLEIFSQFKNKLDKEISNTGEIDHKTGKIRTWAYIGSIKIK